jgi:hypothetical protein
VERAAALHHLRLVAVIEIGGRALLAEEQPVAPGRPVGLACPVWSQATQSSSVTCASAENRSCVCSEISRSMTGTASMRWTAWRNALARARASDCSIEVVTVLSALSYAYLSALKLFDYSI